MEVADERLRFKECETYGYFCPVADRCTIAKLRGKVCASCADEIRRILSEEGFFVVPAGRTTVIMVPDVVKGRDGYHYEGARIYVMSDPSSGISRVDELFVTGMRFGLTDIVFNGVPVYSVFNFFGSDNRYTLSRLMAAIQSEFMNDEGKIADKERMRELQKMLIEVGRELNCHVDERYAFYSTYTSSFEPAGPRRILIVSDDDSLLGPIARYALQKVVDMYEYTISVDSAAYFEPGELHEFAREVIDRLYGTSDEFTPKDVECLELQAFFRPVLDYDLIIVLEERFMADLPEDRTHSIEEITGVRLHNPEDIYEAFEIAETLEDAFRKSMFRILELIY